MSKVPFRSICDRCEKIGELYFFFPFCEMCGSDLCSDCMPEFDAEEMWGVCLKCASPKKEIDYDSIPF